MTYRYLTTLIFCCGFSAAHSQTLAGVWTGELTQNGKPDTFIYSINIEEEPGKVYGTAASHSRDGSSQARFEIGGVRDGQHLTLQEVIQLEPPNARWCLKHIRLLLKEIDGVQVLEGDWEAEGCTPGKIRLVSQAGQAKRPGGNYIEPVYGKYTGHLSQSDRDYGFYFEIELSEDGTGTSRIISDAEGGNAVHLLKWSFDEQTGELAFKESEVKEKSVPDWPWCIKSAQLQFQREADRLSLKGQWKGFIEGYSENTGACAPGYLYLERPVFKKEEITVSEAGNTEPLGVQTYVKQEGRKVEVDRVLLVKSKTVRVRVWDNGIIDGDVLSLFVNGEMILENYRVTRRKHETILKLDKPTNYLILHAINLGSISPNTVAVSVDDGVEEQVVIMSSNLDKSGAIMIRQFTVTE